MDVCVVGGRLFFESMIAVIGYKLSKTKHALRIEILLVFTMVDFPYFTDNHNWFAWLALRGRIDSRAGSLVLDKL